MKLGCQSAPTNDTHLSYLARYGVKNICGYPATATGRDDTAWASVDALSRMKDLATKHGITVDCAGPPLLESSYIDKEKHPAIMLAQSPERDRDIETIQTFIRNCAKVGVPSIKYNMSLLGVLRSGTQSGRGDEKDAVWKLSDAQAKLQTDVVIGGHDDNATGKNIPVSQPTHGLTRAGHVDADAFWERITYFLDCVILVANEYKIRAWSHPPSARPRRAARGLHGDRPRAGDCRWVEEIRQDSGEPISRPEFLLRGQCLRDARRSKQGDPRRDPVLRHA